VAQGQLGRGVIFPEHGDPQPSAPDDAFGARLNASYQATAARQAAERRDQAGREFERRHPRPEARHTGEDGGAHHWAGLLQSGVPWQQPRPRCGCGCEDAGPPSRGTPVDAELDMLARQRDGSAYEQARAETRARLDLAAGPLSWPEAMSRAQAMSGQPLDSREALARVLRQSFSPRYG
jgi:hypothetical protein